MKNQYFLMEVMDTILAAYGSQKDAVLAEQVRKRLNRGGFASRLRLLKG